MTDDRDHDVQDWFNRSVEELPRQPFTLAVLKQIQRRERYLQMPRYAALLIILLSFYLLLPELIAPLNALAALPLVIIDAGGEQWPVLVVAVIGIVWWLVKQARNTGFLRRA